jgi:outer membrane protein
MTLRSCSIALCGVLILGAAAAPARAELKIGVVQYARLMQESPQAKAAQEALRGEFAGKQKELQTQQAALKGKEEALQKNAATMSVDQRNGTEKELRDGNRELQARVQEYQDDFNARQNQELSKLQKALVEEVQNYAQSEKFDLVLADGVIFTNPSLDITPQILAALQAHGGRSSGAASPGKPSGAAGAAAKPAVPPKGK